MTLLLAAVGVGGYIFSLALITSGYALFQAANTMAVLKSATSSHRGVTSALLGLSRNIGLIIGASAMGAVFALGAGGLAGLQLTFAVATGLALMAVAAILFGQGPINRPRCPSPHG